MLTSMDVYEFQPDTAKLTAVSSRRGLSDPDIEVLSVEYDAKEGLQTDSVRVPMRFYHDDNSPLDRDTLTAADWENMIYDAAYTLMPEEPEYGDVVYDRVEEIPEKRRIIDQPDQWGGVEVDLFFTAQKYR